VSHVPILATTRSETTKGPLSLRLLERVYLEKNATWTHGTNTGFLDRATIDWEGFLREYPVLAEGAGESWLRRLADGLRFVE